MGMFEGFKKFLAKIRKFIVEDEVEQELRLDAKEIVNMVRLQLARGISGSGQPVTLKRYNMEFNYYSPMTIATKRKRGIGLGSVTSTITNYMSGNFYNSIRVEIYTDASFQVYSISPLYDIIKYRSGEDIINLTTESEQYLFQHRIAPDLQQEINRLYFAP